MNSYRTLEAWKQAHVTARLTLQATDRAYHPRCRNLFDQVRRATISVEASAAEAECLLRLAAELGYLPEECVRSLDASLAATMRALRGLMRRPPVSPS